MLGQKNKASAGGVEPGTFAGYAGKKRIATSGGIEPGTYAVKTPIWLESSQGPMSSITQGRQRLIWAKKIKRARCVGPPRTECIVLHSRKAHHSDIGLGRVILLDQPNARVLGGPASNQDCYGLVQQPLTWLMISVKAEENPKAKNSKIEIGRVDSNSVALGQVKRALVD